MQWAPLSLKVTDTPPWQFWQQICASPTCIPEQAKHWFPTTQFPVISEREEMLIKCNIPKFASPPPSSTYSHGKCVAPAYRNQCDWKNPLKFLISEMMIVNCWTLFSSSVWALFLSFYRNTWNFLATWIPFESLFDDGHSLFLLIRKLN